MTVGRSAPRYQMMALLYPRSKHLQSHLSEYFIVVVRLCHQLLKFTQKSPFGQFASTLSDSDIKIYQAELDLWAHTIKEEVSLMMAKRIEDEAQENHRFRTLSSKDSKSVSLRQRLKANLRVLDYCTPYDHEKAWKQIRKVGNASLFNRTAEYSDWKGRDQSCTLLYTGKLGSGKSVLLANIVDDLNLYVPKDHRVAYFFCRHDVPESLIARTVIGSLARQLLRQIPDLTTMEAVISDTTAEAEFEKMFTLLKRAIPSHSKVYFILDGLDECDQYERGLIIQQLQNLQGLFTLLLCVSLRLEPNNTLELSSDQFTAAKIIQIPEDNPDIESFISAELESCLETKRLVIGNPAIILKIRDVLLEGSQGMFLWVALQIQSLYAMKTDDAILQALVDLPKDLLETFSRILQRSERSTKPYQRRILELILVAQRPLTTEELREALSVVPGDAVWNPAMLLNDIFSTLTCCGGILIVDEEELTVRLVHHSVKQFLLCGFQDSTKTAITMESAKGVMADTIITYLNYGVFHTQLSTVVIPQVKVGSLPSQIIRSTLDSSNNVRSLALKFLKFKETPGYDIGKTVVETGKIFSQRPVDEFHFYPFAKSYWRQYVIFTSGQNPVLYDLLLLLFKGEILNTNTNTVDEDGRTLLSLAAEKGYERIIGILLDLGTVNSNATDPSGNTPLTWAARKGHKAAVKMLLDSDKVDANFFKGSLKRTPLMTAALQGHDAVVKMLLDSDRVDAGLKDSLGWTPLSLAAGNGHETVVKMLLDSDRVDANSKSPRGQTPLSLAARNGHETVVKMLLDSDRVDANSKSPRGQTPLSLAARNGHETMVKMLLDSDRVDPESKDSLGWTPLSLAARNGHETVVKMLLDSDRVDPESKDSLGWTPLSLAARNGHETVVKMLLNSDRVDANSKSPRGQTPLSLAARNGHETVVKMLLDSDRVDANSKSPRGQTPLSLAAGNGHETVVKILLDSEKVLVDLKDNDGATPLSLAAGNGHETVVKILLNSDRVDPESKDSWGCTPLSRAAENGHETVVKMLLDSDRVDPESKDYWEMTALSRAAGNGHETVVKILLNSDRVDANSKSPRGQTPLSLAARNGHETVVMVLLDSTKVDANARDHLGQTPLSLAVSNRGKAVVEMLLDSEKVLVDLEDNDGNTPLSLAAITGKEEIVKALLDSGRVNANTINREGKTPLSLASEAGHEAVVRLL